MRSTGTLLAALALLAAAPAAAAQTAAPVLPGLFGGAEPADDMPQGDAAPPAPAGPHVEDKSAPASGPTDVGAAAYDSRVRSSFASAESFQGPLDGGWTLSTKAGDLYAFQLADKGHGAEGAWRDLRRPGATDASGLVDSVSAGDGTLVLTFAGAVATLHSGAGEVWSGELDQGGRRTPATLRHSGL